MSWYCYVQVTRNLSAQGLHHDYGETEVSEREEISLWLLAVFIIAASVVTRATIGGVIEQYNIPLSEWTTSMYVIQSSMIFVYSLVFTVLLAIPLGIYFLGGEEQK